MIRAVLTAAATAGLSATSETQRACCVYARALLTDLYGSHVTGKAPLATWHLFAEVAQAHPFAPVEAAEQCGIAGLRRRVTADHPYPGEVLLIQGWRGKPNAPGVTGHTFVWIATDERHGCQIDSVVTRAPAVRFRKWTDVAAEFPEAMAVPLKPPHAL